MYRLLSPQEIVNNLVTLVSPIIKEEKNIDALVIKKAYRQFLSNLQPHCPLTQDEKLFYSDAETEKLFSDYFINEETEIKGERIIPDSVLYPAAIDRKKALEKSLHQLEKIDPDFSDLFHLIMNTVFCTASQKLGGSSVNPQYIGVMCAYYDMNAEEKAIPELLIHEFTHNALILDELCYGHYDYQKMAAEKAQIYVRLSDYSYNISFHRLLHSLIVNAEILLARDAYIGHQPLITQHLPSPGIVKRAKIYISETEKNQYVQMAMTERSRMLFDICKKFYYSRGEK